MFYVNDEPEGFYFYFFTVKLSCIAWYCTAYQWCMYRCLVALRLLLTLTSCTWKVYTDVIHLTDWCRRQGHECIKQHVYKLCYVFLVIEMMLHTTATTIASYYLPWRQTRCNMFQVSDMVLRLYRPALLLIFSVLVTCSRRDRGLWLEIFCSKQRLFLHLNHKFNKQQA